MIEHRVTALRSRKYELVVNPPQGKGKNACASVTASFKAVRKQVSETVQLLTREELVSFVHALGQRGSSRSRGGGGASHLLKPEAMASRSAAILWSVAFVFDGDVVRGVEELAEEAATL